MLLPLRPRVDQISGIFVLGAILVLIPWTVNHSTSNKKKKQQDKHLLKKFVQPLGQCGGPCSDDGDCQRGLYCYQKQLSATNIPSNCDASSGIEGEFFCYKSSSDELPVLRGGESQRKIAQVDIFSIDLLPTRGDRTEKTKLTLVEDDEVEFPLAMCQGGTFLSVFRENVFFAITKLLLVFIMCCVCTNLFEFQTAIAMTIVSLD
jgi:hypothetical protein